MPGEADEFPFAYRARRVNSRGEPLNVSQLYGNPTPMSCQCENAGPSRSSSKELALTHRWFFSSVTAGAQRGRNPVLSSHRRRGRRLQRRLRVPPAGPAQGPDRLRQDALRRVHGAPPARPEAATAHRRAERSRQPDHRRLPRGPDRQRPRRPLPHQGRRDGLDRRPAHAGGEGAAPSATSTRSSRRARTPSSSSIRSPTTAASCRSTRGARSSRRIPTSCSSSPTTPATRAC